MPEILRTPVDKQSIQAEAASVGIDLMYIESPSAKLALWHIGKGPPILLLHGVTYSSMSVFDLHVEGYERKEFSLMMRLAEAGFSAYALDFEGYGLSDSRPGISSIEGYCSDISWALRAIENHSGEPQTSIIGWSWGGQVASRFSGQFPDRVKRLVFWGSFWGGGESGKPKALNGVIPPATARRRNTISHAGADFKTPENYPNDVREAFVRRALQIDPTSSTAGVHAVAYDVPLHSPLNLHMPVLVTHGSHDPMSNPDDVAEFLAKVPHSNVQYEVIKNADHNAQFCHGKKDLDRVLCRFLNQSI